MNVTESLESQNYKLDQLHSISHQELQGLYKQVVEELQNIKIDFEEFQITSKEYEMELENENEFNLKRVKESEQQCQQMQKEYDKMCQKYKDFQQLEKKTESLKKQLSVQEDSSKVNYQKLVNLEIENEDYERQMRISEQIIADLEQKLDTQLEETALLQSELEELKVHSQEQLERLKQQLEETTTELQVKERELKKIKFQQLLVETTQPTLFQQQTSQQQLNFNVLESDQELQKRYSLQANSKQDSGQKKSSLHQKKERRSEEDVFEKSEMILRRPESARIMVNDIEIQNEEKDIIKEEMESNDIQEEQSKSDQENKIFDEQNKYQNLIGFQNEIEENLLMDELDIDDILECEDIEQTAFISSSKQLLNALDSVIHCIDDRINYKKNVYYGISNHQNCHQEEMWAQNNLYGYQKYQGQYHHYNNQSQTFFKKHDDDNLEFRKKQVLY